MTCQQEYFLAKQFSATKATCLLSSQPKASLRVKSQYCNSSLYCSLFTIQARVYCSWLLFKIPFLPISGGSGLICKDVSFDASFDASFLRFILRLILVLFLSQAEALPSLFFLSHHVTPSSLQAFFKLSYLVHCKIFLLMYNIIMF